MFTALLLFFFILGTIIGSFLNVVVLRYGARKISGRSHCLSCGKLLHWHELLPIVSFLAQRGRCRGCKAGISFQYPLVELLTGLVFALIFWKELSSLSLFRYSVIPLLVIQLTLWSLLIAISVYDIRHKIIPDALVYTAGFLSFLILLFSYWETYNLQLTRLPIGGQATYDFFSGFLFALPFAALWFFSKGRAMGLGDAKLILFFPWLLGLPKGLSALIVGFWLGAAISIAGLALKGVARAIPSRFCPTLRQRLRTLTLKTELPLGPFLVLGLFVVYVFGWDVTGLSLLLQGHY